MTSLSESLAMKYKVFLAQHSGYNGRATTATVLPQRLSQPKWGKAVPGQAHVGWPGSRASTRRVLAREMC